MIAAPGSLRVSRIIEADADTLFQAWTDPRVLMDWWRQEGDGWAFAGASIDLRVGGRYRLAMTAPDGRTHAAIGVYREIQRPVRLVFTWDGEDAIAGVGDTLVTVEFTDAGDKHTEVLVTHERFANRARMGRHEQGWVELLRLLERSKGRTRMTARETIDGYFNGLRQKKGWEAFLSNDITFTSFTSPMKRVSGKAAYLAATQRFYSMLTALEVKELLVDANRACALTHYELEPPGGPAFSSDVAEVFGVENGQITSLDIYFDSRAVSQAAVIRPTFVFERRNTMIRVGVPYWARPG